MKLWDKGISTDEKTDQFTVGQDREFDLLLVKYDIQASIAHAQMLAKVGLITNEEGKALEEELLAIGEQVAQGDFTIEKEFEDMHSKIEFLLTERLGDTGKKVHTARSRNDQVLVAMQLYLKDELKAIRTLSKSLFDQLTALAETHKDTLLPGYTHLQVAMPSSFGLWLGAYAETLIDDLYLVDAAYKVCDQNPLGSAAGYGSSFPVDREFTTKALGFSTLKYNAVAAQMGRGKVEKYTAFSLAGIAGTLGKFAMDICLYLSQNFDFISFPDQLTTGSSIMPHKKNPDIFELIRGKCNKLQGLPNTLALLTTNLPSGYHRELQLCKELIVPAIQEMKSCIEMTHFAIAEMQVNTDILEDPKYDYLFSVDTLNQMVLDGTPFREAYKIMGASIENGTYAPNKSVNHTHLGSIGNPAIAEIRQKMEAAK
ncbi:argininosuccinate lyase [Robertkochia sediminum]|uniref:argininosuccinate lyase n=1 Tax=Robertkochia sediminum TaxID=2785326 RepID=UPI0019324B45|nr:argininosuccinate lyase [Robertkochia sediminum]MBL7473345.1 argininosuccinate lyase [Robertkochia sediminum]